MKAKSRFLAAALAFCLIFSLAAVASAAFSDVSGHWAQAQIEKWVDKGLAKGYPDGTFKPNNQVTRAEFVTLLNRAWGNQNPDARCDFTDVKASDWYYVEVAATAKAGYVSGYPDKTFRPNNPISRVEAGAIIARLLKLPAGSESALSAFKDAAAIGAWAKGSISALVAEKLLGGYPDGTFKPADPITRAEAIVLLDRALAYSGKEGEIVPVTGVKLNKDKLSLSVGSTAQLEAIIEPANATNKNVTWSSSDEEIATVDETGKVKGIKVGTATITVTTEDGNKTAACEVDVYRSGGGGGGGGGSTTVSVTGVTLDQATLTLTVGGSAQLTATVSPENATNKNVTWSSSNASVATVDSTGKVTAVAPGTATITVTTVDGNKTASCAVTVTAALPAEIESYTTLTDPLGNTVVVVTIKPEYAEKIASVTVKGQTMNRRPGTNDWQKTLEGEVTVTDADFAVTLKQTVDVIEKADAGLGLFGDTNVYVWLKSGVTATRVTANGTPMSYSDGKYKVTLWNLNAGDKVTLEVTTSQGFQTREVVVREL